MLYSWRSTKVYHTILENILDAEQSSVELIAQHLILQKITYPKECDLPAGRNFVLVVGDDAVTLTNHSPALGLLGLLQFVRTCPCKGA